MSMCYLCDLCKQPHRIDSIHWLDCSKCDELYPKAFDYGRDDPHEICKHFEPKEGAMTYATEKHYRCIKSFELPKCDDDGMESEDGELLTVEVGDTFYRSEVSWMNDVRLEGVGRTWYWLEIDERTFAEHFEEVTR